MHNETAIPHDLERQPLAERLRQYVVNARKSMPDSVRALPPLNVGYLLATGTLKLWTKD